MQFRHFVITRFNIPAWSADKNGRAVRDEQWLKTRINLFEQFCFPSMIHQSNKNFSWLVYFDPQSPEMLKEKIKRWEQQCANFIPIYCNDYNAFQFSAVSEYIQENVDSSCEYVITTRLDNDDALHQDAIAEIQQAFIPRHNTIIDIPNGFCYNTQTHVLTKHTIQSSPFISYVTRFNGEKIDIVYREGHPAWLTVKDIHFTAIQNKRLWIQVIHETNIANSQHGKICLIPSTISEFNMQSIEFNSSIKIIKDRLLQEYYGCKHFVKTKIFKR